MRGSANATRTATAGNPAFRGILLGGLALSLALASCDGGAGSDRASIASAAADTMRVEEFAGALLFFYDRDCPDCEFLKTRLLPRFLERNGLGEESVAYLDVADDAVVRQLLDLEVRLGFKAPALAPVIVFAGRAYCGVGELERSLDSVPDSLIPESVPE